MQLDAIEMQCTQFDVEGRLTQPFRRDVLSSRSILQFERYVSFVGGNSRLDEVVHLKTQFVEEFRRGPIERLSNYPLETLDRLQAENRQAGSRKVYGCGQTGKTAPNHNYI
jgi:hypothetical protein